jgi:hypothetical protein
MICCFFSSFKTFAMLREATYPPAAVVNILDVSSESMAAFGCSLRKELGKLFAACDAEERLWLDADGFWLHKFRATFATKCLWAGVDLRTVQQWLGHSDMESTMRYLKPSRSQQTRDKANEIFARACNQESTPEGSSPSHRSLS